MDTAPNSREHDILDLLLVISDGKRVIARSVLALAGFALAVVLLLPQRFVARTSLLPPQSSQSTATLMAGQITAMTGINARDLGLKNPSDLYVALLESESVANALVERFHLTTAYGVQGLGKARKRLSKRTTITGGKDGLIVVAVEDSNASRAAAIANAYAEELQRLNARLAITEAAQRRLFFEAQLATVKANLAAAERNLGTTEARTGVVEVGAHAKALVEEVALLRGQYAAKEVEVKAMRTFATERNPDYRLALEQLAALRAQLSKLEKGDGEGATGSMKKFSGAAADYIDAVREVKYQEALFELLGRQFEAARIDEAREGAIIQVVDPAIPPEKPSWPNRALAVVVAVLLSGFGASLFVLLKASMQRAIGDPVRAEKLRRLRQSWRVVVPQD